MENQKTIAKSAFFSGIALHTGARATVRIQPAPENTGIIFRRVDMPGSPEVPALAQYVVNTDHGTTIANMATKAMVYTIEHIMSALNAWQVDNAYVEMDGMEPPIADGSSLPYFNMIQEAGVVEQSAPAKIFTPSAPVFVEMGGSKLMIAPGNELKISCFASFQGCPKDPQYMELVITTESYQKEIAGGRTFVRYNDLKQLLAAGLVKGGSLDAAAILHDGAIICKEELRFPDEIVRHKILDLVGDIFLCGCRVRGTIIAIKPGHTINVKLCKELLQLMK